MSISLHPPDTLDHPSLSHSPGSSHLPVSHLGTQAISPFPVSLAVIFLWPPPSHGPFKSPCPKFYPKTSHEANSLMSRSENRHSWDYKSHSRWRGGHGMALHCSLLDAQALLCPQNTSSLIRVCSALSVLLRKDPAIPSSVSSSVKVCVPSGSSCHTQHPEPARLL